MKIILAKTAGFCFGVKRAVDLAFKYQDTQNTYTFGPIIHNDRVVNDLASKGVKPIENLEEGHIDTLIIRSHGAKPTVYNDAESKEVNIVDATCPYVKKIHKLVAEYSKKGHPIILVGNRNHPEIQGINGWANDTCIIVKDVEELESVTLPKDEKPYLVVAQTTYKKEVVEKIVAYLESKHYHFKYINTICNATKERQEEATEIASAVDAMLVIGSEYSSNTLKLYEICKKHCAKSYCIADASMLDLEALEGCEMIGITAGASTPKIVIEEIIQKLNQMQQGENDELRRF